MKQDLQFAVLPEEAAEATQLKKQLALRLGVEESDISWYKVVRRSIDARGRVPKISLKIEYVLNVPGYTPETTSIQFEFKDAGKGKKVYIIGAGPAGYFAALRLLEEGFKPIIIERGKEVKERRRDLVAITRDHDVDPNSNYCFGEGGAGTYSDGKLYTRSTKRGDVKKVLELLVYHGAHEEILVEAHPHIGTNKLPGIITNIRETILHHGGEVYFNLQFINLEVKDGALQKIVCKHTISGELTEFYTENVILATGHSSRDVFELLHKKGILIESKPFAMGVRIEHPQTLIDQIQYHQKERSPYLPPASYSLVTQAKGKGVYSFCMCPGGIIAPCATAPGEVVTNGWSPSKRNNPFANSGLVVEVKPEDLAQYKSAGPLAGLRLQQQFEKAAFNAGGQKQSAPAQRLVDFLNNRISNDLPECSYIPGIVSAPLNILMPNSFTKPMQEAFKDFGNKMRGYVTNEAVLVGFETRTSSPVRIPRDNETLEHPQVKGLYPCAEGAGYAGGIVSAAIDGQRCAEAIMAKSL